MHKEILTKEQIELLPLVKEFKSKFYMVGGTAIAFHIGHRRSIDFDLFSEKNFQNFQIRKKLFHFIKKQNVLVERSGELTAKLDGVKFTFFHFPYKIPCSEKFENVICMPDLLTLAAMKAFAMGQRNKWKDYVDLYFIMKDFHTLSEISGRAKKLFNGGFNERMFREQLGYFADVNYEEKVEYMKGFKISNDDIEKALIEFSVS